MNIPVDPCRCRVMTSDPPAFAVVIVHETVPDPQPSTPALLQTPPLSNHKSVLYVSEPVSIPQIGFFCVVF